MSDAVSNKFKSLVHYIVSECPRPELLGAVRLNKALWFTDRTAYKLFGESVTGTAYIRKPQGPVAKFMPMCIDALVAEGAISVAEPEAKYDVRKFKSERPPATDSLSEDEKALAHHMLLTVIGETASAISAISHDLVWSLAADGEEIPLCATLVSREGEVTPEILAWARSS